MHVHAEHACRPRGSLPALKKPLLVSRVESVEGTEAVDMRKFSAYMPVA